MKSVLIFISLSILTLQSYSQYNPKLWQIDNHMSSEEAISGFIPANGFGIDPDVGNIWTTPQYQYEWVGENNDILKITFVNTKSPNYDPMGLNTLQWRGNEEDPKFMFDKNGLPHASYKSAVGQSVDFTLPENALVSFDIIANDNLYLRVDCQSIDGKVSNQYPIGLAINATSNINLSNQNQWQKVLYSWDGNIIADVYTETMYDGYSPQWYGVDNPHEKTDNIALADSAIVGVLFTIDEGNYALGSELDPITKTIYIRNLKIGDGNAVPYKVVPEYKYTLSSDTLYIQGDVLSSTIHIDTDSAWTVSSSENWVSFTQSSGNGSDDIEIHTELNDGSTRTAQAIFVSGKVRKKVTIIQYSLQVQLSTSSVNLLLGKHEGSSTNFEVTAIEASWIAKTNVNWLQVSQTMGAAGTHTVIVDAHSNPSENERIGIITISAGGLPDITIQVTQEAGPVLTPVSSVIFLSDYPNSPLHYLAIPLGEQHTFVVEILPTTATNPNLLWESSDTTIVKVDQAGTATALKRGGVTITGKTLDGTDISSSVQVGAIETKPIVEISTQAGYLPVEFSYLNTSEIRELTVNGYINQSDLSYIQGMLIYLEKLDLHNATIVQSTGYNGEMFPANEIPARMFQSPPTRQLKEIILPNNLSKINDEAFRNNTNLETVVFPSTITQIGESAFSNCSNLQVIDLPINPSNVAIASNTFDGVNKQTCVLQIPTGTKSTLSTLDFWKDFVLVQEIDTTTAIIENEIKITLYPNPANKTVYVSGVSDFTYVIHNMAGIIVAHGIAHSEISIASLAQGMYTIQIVSGSKVFYIQFLKF